jgi:hypothetical protein
VRKADRQQSLALVYLTVTIMTVVWTYHSSSSFQLWQAEQDESNHDQSVVLGGDGGLLNAGSKESPQDARDMVRALLGPPSVIGDAVLVFFVVAWIAVFCLNLKQFRDGGDILVAQPSGHPTRSVVAGYSEMSRIVVTG